MSPLSFVLYPWQVRELHCRVAATRIDPQLQKRHTYLALAICGILAAAIVCAYWEIRNADFITAFDDNTYLTENLTVQRGVTPENLAWAFTTFHFNNWHPLTWLSYMAECHLFGLNPAAFHLVNLGFHVANTLLLFLLLRRQTTALWASATVAALFGLHPLHVESVAWISERKDVLSTLFGLLTIWAYDAYSRKRSMKWYVIALVLFASSLMSKAMLVTLPFLLLLLDFWPLRRIELNSPVWLRATSILVFEKIPFFVMAAAASFLAYFAQGDAVAPLQHLSFAQRLANAVVSYPRYISKTLWPVDLAVYYPHPLQWPVDVIIAAVLLITALTLAAVRTMRKQPYFFTGWFWFVGTLIPVIGLVQIGSQSVADRYLYFPSIGLFIIIVWSVREFVQTRYTPLIPPAVVATAVLAACAVFTIRQIRYWQDSIVLLAHAERVTGPSVIVLNNLGHALINSGRIEEGRRKLEHALALQPGDHLRWVNVANAALREGNLDRAVEHYRGALRLNPDNPGLNMVMGLCLVRQKNFREAVPYYQQAISKQPAYLDAYLQLGDALAFLGDLDSALTNYLAVIDLKGDLASPHQNAGKIYAETGRLDEALKHLTHAVRLDPHDALGRFHLASALARNGDAQAAIVEYEQAIRLDPSLVLALNNLAWLRATHPDAVLRNGAEAVRLAEQACDLSQRGQAFALGTLAAAYAEVGRFDEAIRTAEKAIELAESQRQHALAERNRQLLASYKASQPWREPHLRDTSRLKVQP